MLPTRVFFRRFLVALIGFSLLVGSPSLAMTGCSHMSKMAVQMTAAMPPAMAMPMKSAADTGKADHHNMPCKMPAGLCASMCAAMTSVALIPLQFVVATPIRMSDAPFDPSVFAHSIATPPALPPPILLI